jgi:hypothetical protein
VMLMWVKQSNKFCPSCKPMSRSAKPALFPLVFSPTHLLAIWTQKHKVNFQMSRKQEQKGVAALFISWISSNWCIKWWQTLNLSKEPWNVPRFWTQNHWPKKCTRGPKITKEGFMTHNDHKQSFNTYRWHMFYN